MIVVKVSRLLSLYMLHTKIYNQVVNVVKNVDISKLCHKQLAHISKKDLALFDKKYIVCGLKNIDSRSVLIVWLKIIIQLYLILPHLLKKKICLIWCFMVYVGL